MAQICPHGKAWVSAHPRSEYQRGDGTHYSAAEVIGYCRSKRKSDEYWAPRLTNGKVRDWPHKNEIFKTWSRSEIEMTLSAFSKISPNLWRPVLIFRADRSKYKDNSATASPGSI